VTHTTFQKLLLTPFTVHEILEFEILSSEKHFCHDEISQILFRAENLDPWADPGSPVGLHWWDCNVFSSPSGPLSQTTDQAGGDDSEGKTEIFVIKESIRNHAGGG